MPQKRYGKKCQKGAAWKLRCQTREKWKLTALANSSFIFHKKRTGEPVTFFFSLKAAQGRWVGQTKSQLEFRCFPIESILSPGGSCAAKNLTSRHFSGCSLCFAGELNERPYPSPNLHFTQLSESKLLRMISIGLVLAELTFTFVLIFPEMYQKNSSLHLILYHHADALETWNNGLWIWYWHNYRCYLPTQIGPTVSL